MIFINDKERPYGIRYFPDGSLNMTDTFIQEQSDLRTVFITWKFENIAEQVVIYNLVNYIKDVLSAKVILTLPYVPNARMDRVKKPIYEVHTLKYFCKFLNSLDIDRIYVIDPHSPVTMTLLERAVEVSIKETVQDLVDMLNVDYTFFPDKGALDRYDYLLTRTPFYGVKKRDWDTGKILGYQIENPYNIKIEDYIGKSALIIDDISSFGTTFLHASRELKTMGFGDIYLYVTHCENSILKGEVINSPDVKHIYTTSSIFTGEHPKITVLKK